MIAILRHILPNFFRLGLIQVFSILLQFLLIPLVVSRAGLIENAKMLTALSIAGLFSIVVNYGTSQSGPMSLLENEKEGSVDPGRSPLKVLLFVRILLFLAVAALFVILYWLQVSFAIFLLGTLPILLSEVLNPYVVCIGTNRLSVLTGLNFFGRSMGFLLVYFFWNDPALSYMVNFYVGIGSVIVFLFFWVVESVRGRLRWGQLSLTELLRLVQQNFSLVASNMLVYLQQSLVLYTIGIVATAPVLGVYAIIDKLIWGFRMLLISFSGAVFASALNMYNEGQKSWSKFRGKINRLLAGGLLIAALLLVAIAKPLAVFLAGQTDPKALAYSIGLAAVIPLLAGLNLLNVLELILQKQFARLNAINGRVFLGIALLCAFLWSLHLLQIEILFWMPVLLLLLAESITLLIYEKDRHHTR